VLLKSVFVHSQTMSASQLEVGPLEAYVLVY